MGEADAVIALAGAAGLSVGCAESVTGGLVASALVAVVGASSVVRGAVVAYDSSVKTALLGVPAPLLADSGPVSDEVALAMAHGARELLKVDVAVATTGVAGPQPHGGQQPGTVVVAVVGAGEDAVRRFALRGDRSEVRQLAADAAVGLLAEVLRVRHASP